MALVSALCPGGNKISKLLGFQLFIEGFVAYSRLQESAFRAEIVKTNAKNSRSLYCGQQVEPSAFLVSVTL